MMSVRVGLTVACTVLLSFSASAVRYDWVGGNGKWSDPAKWKNTSSGMTNDGFPQTVDDKAYFTVATPSTIEVDGDYAVNYFYMGNFNWVAGGVATTLTGTGTLTVANALEDVSYASIVMDVWNMNRLTVGCGLRIQGAAFLRQDSALELVEGADWVGGNTVNLFVGAELKISGGKMRRLTDASFSCGTVNMSNAGKVLISGGEVSMKFATSIGELSIDGGVVDIVVGSSIGSGTSVSVTGGTVMCNETITHPGLFPSGATVVLGSGGKYDVVSTSGTELPLNGGTVAGAGSFKALKNFSITGGGSLVFNGGMNFEGGDNDMDSALFDIDELVLGSTILRPMVAGHYFDGTVLEMLFPREVTVGCTNANWFVKGYLTDMVFEKGVTVDTTDRADGETGRSITLRRATLCDGAYLRAIGNGTAEFALYKTDKRPVSVSIEDSVTFQPSYSADFRYKPWRIGRLSAAEGTTIRLGPAYYAYWEADELDLDPGMTVSAGTPDATLKVNPGIIGGPTEVDVFLEKGAPTVAVDSLDWTGKAENGSVFFYKNGATSTLWSDLNGWTGATDGFWNTAGNWSANEVPNGTTVSAKITGFNHTRITNDVPGGVDLANLRMTDVTAPLVIEGNEIRLFSTSSGSESDSVYSASTMPVVFRCPVRHDATGADPKIIVANNSGESYLAFMDEVDGNARLDLYGDVRIGGYAHASNVRFMPKYSGAPTRVTILSNATLAATWHSLANNGPQGGMLIEKGGKFTAAKGSAACYWGYSSYGYETPTEVNGTFETLCPLGGSIGQYFTGTGRVKLTDTGAKATADYKVKFGGEVNFSVGTFVKSIEVVGKPTWLAVNDWTYSLGTLALPDGCVLTVDTQDPDAANTAHACTLASALDGTGALVKKGAGTLTLSAVNAIGGGVTVAGGTLVLGAAGNAIGGVTLAGGTLSVSGAQDLGSLSGTGTLAPAAGASLTVAQADLSGITLALDAATLAAAKEDWTTVLTLPVSADVEGRFVLPTDKWRMRVVVDGDGTKSVQVRGPRGLAVIVR